MLLIKELTEEVTYLAEDKGDGSKQYFIEGIIMQGDIKNRNGRMYPSKILAKEMARYNETYVTPKRAYGELGHPDSPTINLDRVSHIFTNLKQEGSNIVGRAKVLDTPMGKIVKNFIEEGTSLGISSRGMGSLKENKQGIMEVQEDFMLATAGDIVADPSAPNAFVNGIMEGVQFYYDLAEGKWKAQQVLENIEKEGKISYKQLEENALARFESFIKSLS